MPEEIAPDVTADEVVDDTLQTEEPTGEETASGPVDWRESLPEDMRNDPAFKDISDVGGLGKAYLNAQSLVGRKGVIKPGKDADQSEWDKYYAELGRPEDASGYENPANQQGVMTEEQEKFFRETAHRLGLSKQQYAGLVRDMLDRQVANQAAAKLEADRANQEAAEALMRDPEFGGAAFDRSLRMAQAVSKQFDDDEGTFVKALEEAGVANNMGVLRFLARVGRAMSEDEVHGTGRSLGMDLTPSEATEAIASMMNDPEKSAALRDQYHPKHKEVIAEWNKLHAYKRGEK